MTQVLKPPVSIVDDELHAVLTYLHAGAGVDNHLLDALDNALTSDPKRHVLILIERAPLGGQPLTLEEVFAATRQPQAKPKPKPKPEPKPNPTGHPYP